MKFNLALLLSLCINTTFSQRIRVGESVPDLELGHVINFSKESVKLSDFKGKLVILDFWQTSCSSCIKGFKKLDSLQKKFADFIQVIAVNNESQDSTEKFFTLRKNIVLPKVPFVTGDTALTHMFPRNYAPWHVWIDNQGVVRFITESSSATESNIKDFLAGKTINLPQLKYLGLRMIATRE